MEGEETVARRTRSPEAIVVSITVKNPQRSRARPLGERLTGISVPRRRLAALVIVLVLVAVGAGVTSELPGDGTARSATFGRAERVTGGERAAIAGALGYPYPLRCLTITIAAGEPDYARADVDRTHGCGRYRGYTNASLHRVGGAWRLVLDEGQLFVPNSRLRGAAADPGTPGGAR
jgi:hypothetical protein